MIKTLVTKLIGCNFCMYVYVGIHMHVHIYARTVYIRMYVMDLYI